jgi:hypothetical protein
MRSQKTKTREIKIEDLRQDKSEEKTRDREMRREDSRQKN